MVRPSARDNPPAPVAGRVAKWSWAEVRRGLLGVPGGRVVEVQPAGAVEGFFGGTDRIAAWQDGVFVSVLAGQVDGKAPPVGIAAIAQPAQGQGSAVGQLAGD